MEEELALVLWQPPELPKTQPPAPAPQPVDETGKGKGANKRRKRGTHAANGSADDDDGGGADPTDAEAKVSCIDCAEDHRYGDTCSTGGSRCTSRRCKQCHNARRAVHSWYSKANRLDEWSKLSVDEKRQLTVANRGKGGTKGRRREVVGSEAVACTDSVGLRHEAPFLTKLQFFATLKERYTWATDESCEQEWTRVQGNSAAIWRRDEFGEQTVSLLKTATATSGRQLDHKKEMSRADVHDAEQNPDEVFRGLLANSSLHAESRVFDMSSLNNFSSMPLLPGAEAPVALSSAQVKRKAVKAKAKPKGKVQGADNWAGSASGSSKRDRDDELLQLDLKREQIKTFQRAEDIVAEHTQLAQDALTCGGSMAPEHAQLVKQRLSALKLFADRSLPQGGDAAHRLELSPASLQLRKAALVTTLSCRKQNFLLDVFNCEPVNSSFFLGKTGMVC
ncbi:unnamed protein product [Effrenium voratum]|nr:unnamed protein product [Effrenium voratum]